MGAENLRALRAAIASIDTRAATYAISSARIEAEAIAVAIDTTIARIEEIDLTLSAEKRRSEAVADALIDGAKPSEAAAIDPSRSRLTEERETLHGALGDLRQRHAAANDALAQAQRTLFGDAADRVAPCLLELLETAKVQAKGLADTLACIVALSATTRREEGTSEKAQVALHGLMKSSFLLPSTQQVQVPVEFLEALKPIEEVPGLSARVPSQVAPRSDDALSFAAGFAAGAAQQARKTG